MPKGKGTYGSKVGRPKVKAKGYHSGGFMEPEPPGGWDNHTHTGEMDTRNAPTPGFGFMAPDNPPKTAYQAGGLVNPRGRGVMTNTDGLSNVPGFNAMDRRNVIPGMTGEMDTPIFMGGYNKGGKVEGVDTAAPSGEEGGASPRKGPVQALQDASELDG